MFTATALDPNDETCIMYVASLVSFDFNIYLSNRAQIALLIQNRISIMVVLDIVDFTNVFSLDLTVELLGHIKIKNYPINLVEHQQPPYRYI